MKKSILALCCLFFVCLGTMAQKKYVEHSVFAGVKVDYKWKRQKQGKDQLWLKLKNTNEFPVTISIEINFYINGMLEEDAQLISHCLKAGETAGGLIDGVFFVPSVLTNEQLRSEDFSLEMVNFDVDDVKACE